MQLPIPPPPDSDNHNPLSFSVSFFNSVYLFLAVLSFHCCTGFLQLQQVGATLVVMHRHLISVTSLVEHRPWGLQASVAAAHRLCSCGLWAVEHRLSSCGART